ncbi:enoyl-CoA hydratase/isomerase family protein [Persicimonas caeni]|uniref:Enoyl-CoA hydratase/isomerase family protein n=1 Tax=Persicimonas caeni TaxID=2292766 RepID=A0A4Y6Q0H8_PERCE|nr:enoyl-CoA hydratase/isomerase family protein [Persicimonas caeni]QDG54074.1 enoyl-CoA hydratase/isomerase family protein [Persicimonas caeni]QED35295.1 enoyl-CoA hydratase/isomerase family protein [Persicimonas caeni]
MSEDLIVSSTQNHVRTLRMNLPRKLNGWTMAMMEALFEALDAAEADEDVEAVILTGTDPYYSAGVNLSSTIQLDHPRRLHEMIVKHNQELFDNFIDFDKPILVAVNGPAIGATVTSATLCDAIIASEKATFSTPFARLGVTPEGCSSVHLPRLIGEENAQRMLGPEGWQPDAEEALEIGLVDEVTAHDELLDRAQAIAEEWIEADKPREFGAGSTREELKEINARESRQLADAFLDTPFLMGQYRFLWSREKYGPALVFLALSLTRPLWSKLLDD